MSLFSHDSSKHRILVLQVPLVPIVLNRACSVCSPVIVRSTNRGHWRTIRTSHNNSWNCRNRANGMACVWCNMVPFHKFRSIHYHEPSSQMKVSPVVEAVYLLTDVVSSGCPHVNLNISYFPESLGLGLGPGWAVCPAPMTRWNRNLHQKGD